MSQAWTDLEIDLIVADYFEMLKLELLSEPYVKSEHNSVLQQHIKRSRSAIEFKHQNISAVMLGLGQPWISGYKPAANFQNALVDGILRQLDKQPDWPANRSGHAGSADGRLFEEQPLWIGPPPTQRNEPSPVNTEFMAALGRKYDVAARDEANRKLGKAGESVVLASEKLTLRNSGRPELADRVRWTANEDGDGHGYDIHSFEVNGADRFIEVKTTNGWERTPFHISRNELRVAEEYRDNWHLVRLWDFARKPQAFALRPPLEDHAELTATSFLAQLR